MNEERLQGINKHEDSIETLIHKKSVSAKYFTAEPISPKGSTTKYYREKPIHSKGTIVKYYKEKEEFQRAKKKNKSKKNIPTLEMLTNEQKNLYDELRSLRRELALKENIPQYMVFNNTSLLDMCIKLPENENEFKEVYGVGVYKHKKYGELFISKIIEYSYKN